MHTVQLELPDQVQDCVYEYLVMCSSFGVPPVHHKNTVYVYLVQCLYAHMIYNVTVCMLPSLLNHSVLNYIDLSVRYSGNLHMEV